MMAGILSIHTPLVRDYPGAPPSPPAPPAPPDRPRPLPPDASRMAFSAVVLPSLSAPISVAVASTTLATVTCADAAMTISVSEQIAGLTFSYAANVLTVAGTPTASGAWRAVVSYIASDGSNTIRGSTEHTIVVIDASGVLTIGGMAAVSGRVGMLVIRALCDLATNYPARVTAHPATLIPGLTVGLSWNQFPTYASGNSLISGTPTAAISTTLTIVYRTDRGVIGASTHVIDIAAAYAPMPSTPAPTPAPSPTTPPTPPASSPVTVIGAGPDALLSSVRVRMRFATLATLATDECGNTFTNGGTTLTTGAVGDAADFSTALTYIRGEVAGLAAIDTGLFAECMVNIGATAWTALMAAGDGLRFCHVCSYVGSDGKTVWALGFASYIDGRRRVVRPLFANAVQGSDVAFVYALSNDGGTILNRPGRFVHLGGGRTYSGGSSKFGAWFDGTGGPGVSSADALKESSTGTLKIGGACPMVDLKINGAATNVIPFAGAVDELRVTVGTRNSAYFGTPSNTDLPASARVIPWPNY